MRRRRTGPWKTRGKVSKSELLTRDESEGDRCGGDTSDLQRMYASHRKMATAGDKPVGASDLRA